MTPDPHYNGRHDSNGYYQSALRSIQAKILVSIEGDEEEERITKKSKESEGKKR